MELRRLSIFIALFVLAFVAQCSEARHSMERREVDDIYDDVLADEASDDEAQNDADGGNDQADEDIAVNASIVTKPSSYNATVESTIRLACKVSPDDGSVVVQWKRNQNMYFFGTQKNHDIDISSYTKDSRFYIAANSTDLVITNVSRADAGVYKCEILQPDHPAVEHTLTIHQSPKIVRFTASDNGTVMEGNDLRLTCEVEGTPQPQILWSWEGNNGNKRLEEKDGEFTLNSVYIKNVNHQHSGNYYCYAFNGVGTNQAELKVTVLGKPRVHVHKNVVNSAVNIEAVLECFVKDHLASHIRWYKDGALIEDSSTRFNLITNGQNSTLAVTPATDSDFGTFTCEAENELGKHNKSIELVQNPVVEKLSVDGPKLTWTVRSHQPLEKIEIQLRDISGDGEWQPIDVPLPSTKSHEYEVIYDLHDKVQTGKYEASVRVKNDKSWSAQTDTAFVDIMYRDLNSGAHSERPVSIVLLSTTFMYLLVRML
ncbi:opioid-binding protein/cell adhesion molecule homolog isoform X2 [Epargyreus clarus]|uniref:opioid-binding protein/cell adhesion molecule homolog isoform X2 n=1 Tax=Epargyreus clarus TaxID=520877 RepID=UPI003C2B3F9D